MSPKKIGYFLEKFKQLTPPDDFLKTHISQFIEEEIGLCVDKKQINISKKIVYIDAKPLIKNEIFFRKESLLEKINKTSKGRIIKDIR